MWGIKPDMKNIGNPRAWARKNKTAFVNRVIIQSGAHAHNEPAAFFMAGLPGSGKTEFTKNLIDEAKLKVVRIDMDEIASQIDAYDPLYADAFRPAATDLLNRLFDKVLKRKVDFIMDGTFRSDNSLSNIKRALKKDYVVKVLYIHQEPSVAWSFTQAREKVERRSIDRAGFIQSYFDIHDNIHRLAEETYKSVTLDLVVKDSANKVGAWHENVSIKDIDRLVNARYNETELERMLEQ